MNENLKKAASLLIDFVKQGEASFKDGFQFSDLFAFVGEFSALPAVIASKDAMLAEWKGRTTESIQDLLNFIDTNLAIVNKDAEAKIKAGIAAAIANFSLIELFIAPATPVIAKASGPLAS